MFVGSLVGSTQCNALAAVTQAIHGFVFDGQSYVYVASILTRAIGGALAFSN